MQYKLLRDETAQREFVSNDLFSASQNKSIHWIIVYLYKPMYSSPSQHASDELLRNIYHPLFDYYGVDLVLQAHNHNYQRSFPIRFNHTNSSNPVVTDRIFQFTTIPMARYSWLWVRVDHTSIIFWTSHHT
jgi:calcineurin-like phosphoesterase family protein